MTGHSGGVSEAMHQLIRSNFINYWFGIFAKTYRTQRYLNPITLSLNEATICLIGSKVVWVVCLSNDHKVAQDNIQPNNVLQDFRRNFLVRFNSEFSVHVCVHICGLALFCGTRSQPQPPGNKLANIFVMVCHVLRPTPSPKSQ